MYTKNWTPDNLPDLSGRTIVITGANSGIGFYAARHLAERGARLALACRNPARAADAADAITRTYPAAQISTVTLDLGNFDSVREGARALDALFPHIDILINNAGVLTPAFTPGDGQIEPQFKVNHLGHFLLTTCLWSNLVRAAAPRVVSVASEAHRAGDIDFDNLRCEKGYRPWRGYAASKLANLLFTVHLQERLAPISANARALACHPGYAATNLQTNLLLGPLGNRLLAQDPEIGAYAILRAATEPDPPPASYWGPRRWFGARGLPQLLTPAKRALEVNTARRLWEVSEMLTESNAP